MKKIYFISLISIMIVIFDQLTKYLASFMTKVLIITNFLNIELIKNYGAGFGILQGQRFLLTLISLLVVGIIIFYFKKIPENKYIQIFIAILLGGTIGNLIDRLFYGYVIDFISFSFWPAFNIADSAICIGAIGLIIYYWKK